MVRFLLLLILIAVLFGGGAAFAVLELGMIAYLVFAAIVMMLYGVAIFVGIFSRNQKPIEYHPMRQKAPHMPDHKFRDMGDYLDWANRRGRHQDKAIP